MKKKYKNKIQKWDEVNGITIEEEVSSGASDPDEVPDNTLSRDKNPIKSVEDMVEQNDNNLDGIINNMPEEKSTAQKTSEDVIEEEQKKKSVLKKLQENTPAPRGSNKHLDSSQCSELERI